MGVQEELPKGPGLKKGIWLLAASSNAEVLKTAGKSQGHRETRAAAPCQRWFGVGTPHHGVPLGVPGALAGARPHLLPFPSTSCTQPQQRQEPGCPDWGNNLGCSCWGENHPKMAIITPKLRALSPSLHSQHCQEPPEPRQSKLLRLHRLEGNTALSHSYFPFR